MSYKVETTAEDHEAVLREAIHDWTRQEPDVHLVSKEGHRIFSHKILLSFYSSQLQQIFSEPSVAFSPRPLSISVPSSSSIISSLLDILVTGTAKVIHRIDVEELKSTASILGIELNNCFLDNGMLSSSRTGLTLVRLPQNFSNQSSSRTTLEQTLDEETELNDLISKQKELTKNSKLKTKREKDVIKKMDKTLETIVKYEAQEYPVNQSEETVQKVKNQCDTCSKTFSKRDKLKRHMLTHLPDSEKPYKCEDCNRAFAQKVQLKIHLEKHHNMDMEATEVSMAEDFENKF